RNCLHADDSTVGHGLVCSFGHLLSNIAPGERVLWRGGFVSLTGAITCPAGGARCQSCAWKRAEKTSGGMKRKHEMPFGAEIRDDGTARFRLWAPKASSVALQLNNHEGAVPMSKVDEGWFELATEAKVGAQYSFTIDDKQLVPDPASRF